MYLLINSDKTINLVGEHPVNRGLVINGLSLVEFPDKAVADVMGDIKSDEAMWDSEKEQIVRVPIFDAGSNEWRQQQASQRINQFYPLYKQINLLRSGDKVALKKMALFIDKCRKWSNDLSVNQDIIGRIEP